MSITLRSGFAGPVGDRRTAQKVRQRRDLIISLLERAEKLSVEELITGLDASPATVRRDLRQLEREGLVWREHGFVALAEPFTFGPFLKDPGFRQQIHHRAEEKRRIGAAAAALIQDGDTIGLAPGTTTAQIARLLTSKRNLTVVTNAVNLAMELSHRKDFTIHLTGGYLSGDWFAMVGPRALDFIETMFLDKFFFGANGIHSEYGITDRHTEEATINEAMVRRAKKRILVADHTKFGEVAKCLVCPIREVNTIITDRGAGEEAMAPFRARGIEVLCV